MAEDLNPQTYQWISQQGVLRVIDASTGPDGPMGVTSHWLVPSNGWHNGQRFPHDVNENLKEAGLETAEVEGLEYFLVPEVSSNLPGQISHYAQTTGVADLANPPGGGVNRARETLEAGASHTVAPDEVAKYVEETDSYEESLTKESELQEQVNAQVTVSPARDNEGKLTEGEEAPAESESAPAESPQPTTTAASARTSSSKESSK